MEAVEIRQVEPVHVRRVLRYIKNFCERMGGRAEISEISKELGEYDMTCMFDEPLSFIDVSTLISRPERVMITTERGITDFQVPSKFWISVSSAKTNIKSFTISIRKIIGTENYRMEIKI